MRGDEVYVDAGAFNGKTVTDFIFFAGEMIFDARGTQSSKLVPDNITAEGGYFTKVNTTALDSCAKEPATTGDIGLSQ